MKSLATIVTAVIGQQNWVINIGYTSIIGKLIDLSKYKPHDSRFVESIKGSLTQSSCFMLNVTIAVEHAIKLKIQNNKNKIFKLVARAIAL